MYLHSRLRLGILPRASVSPSSLCTMFLGRARPRATSAGLLPSLTTSRMPAVFGGPLVRPQCRRPHRVARRLTELGS
ncbi:hypothetical protein NDU88_004516 [Pleurodeles waltl]|uniref:Secreted protein n=1 Tax=Pleurodeles waltl TaxID=8319 RepID=A0AAV7V1G5_PLEWA|nr:hypothetical protein NDU88_004516 [Pleurodeles waltl]